MQGENLERVQIKIGGNMREINHLHLDFLDTYISGFDIDIHAYT